MMPVRLALSLALSPIVLVATSQAGHAADGDLQRALLTVGCINGDITNTLNKDGLVIYKANCFGTAHKVIKVVCADKRCSVSGASTERDE